jgi:hypothetical protein
MRPLAPPAGLALVPIRRAAAPVPVRALVSSVLAASLLAACPSGRDDDEDGETPGDDDGADDDSAGDDDDGSPADLCDEPGPPYSLQISGSMSAPVTFGTLTCTDYNGDEWSLSYGSDSGWILRVVAGPLAQGQELGSGIEISLLNNGKMAIFSGITDDGHVAAVTPERYEPPAAPCGTWTTATLVSPGDDGSVDLGPQPIPFRCP